MGSDSDSHSDASSVVAIDEANVEDAAEEININIFEELRLPKDTVSSMLQAWQRFLSCFDTREACGSALYGVVFESVPSLQTLFKTPKVIQALRMIDELDNLVKHLQKPKELKQYAESIAFRHLNFEVTVPRAMIFRDALVDCLKAELCDDLSEEARMGFMALFGWVGGAHIYTKTTYGDRLKILRESWTKVSSREKNEEVARIIAEDVAQTANKEEEEKGEKSANDDASEGSVSEDFSDHVVATKQEESQGCCAFLRRRGLGSSAAPSAGGKDGSSRKNVADGAERTAGNASNAMVVPMTFSDMFRFNAQVMGFGVGGWMDQILHSLGDIVMNAADATRLHEECDLLSLRIDKVSTGQVPNLSQFKSCMLASLRSLLPKEWDTNYEVAWNWLWDNVAQLLVKTLGSSMQWEAAVNTFFASLADDTRYELRASIYDRFFASTPAGQEYFKQSDTRLHFIVEKVFTFSMEIYADPWQLIDDLSALGLRHVGYGVPTDMFAPFVNACVDVIKGATEDGIAVIGFRTSLGIVAKQLVRTVAEGSTIVMKAVNANSRKMLQRAISCAPRGQRFQWLLKVQVGTQSISPLYWAIESGNVAAADEIIKDLLAFRADRERYYYGNDALFERHQDIINRLCREAPMLMPTLLDGLIWRSARTERGRRRVNYYVKHLVVNQEGDAAEFLREICTIKDPKIMVHPVVVTVSDTLWNGLVRNHFLLSRLWFLASLLIFMLSEAILPKEPDISSIWEVRLVVFFGRTFMYGVTMTRLLIRFAWKSCKDIRRRKTFKFMGIPLPKHLHNAMAVGNLALAVLLMLMCTYEPMYQCLVSVPKDWPTMDCEDAEDIRWTYSALGLLAMAVHWSLMVDLAVFSTGLSAFVLVCAQVLSEIGRFLVALIFLLLTFGSAISVLEHPYFEMRDIPNSVLCLFSITILLYEDDYRTLMEEPALLTAVLLFVLASSILLMNLLIAQLNSSYVYIYQDMVGFARLNRAQKIVEALANVNKQHWSTFVSSLCFDQPLEFNQGDVGVAGGIQITEPASEHLVLKDSILRFGGSCSMELEWPEEAKKSEDLDKLTKIEKLAKKVLRRVAQEARNGRTSKGSNQGHGPGTSSVSSGQNESRAGMSLADD
ncbi:unnamed protein product [Effrenium voratum]|uniref:Globin domain-containing protein n=1 Tax=Effrenium voratum TaxID=2562239 RepID=A0AA36HM10_9DINO|nr:unnamed protein product [Effrenium voratum]